MQPTADEQIAFLVKLQRLLDEGLFVASYKFALLLALADLSVENGDDSGAALVLSVEMIAEKFISIALAASGSVPGIRAGPRSSAEYRQTSGDPEYTSNGARQARRLTSGDAEPFLVEVTRKRGRHRGSCHAALETPDGGSGSPRFPLRERRGRSGHRIARRSPGTAAESFTA